MNFIDSRKQLPKSGQIVFIKLDNGYTSYDIAEFAYDINNNPYFKRYACAAYYFNSDAVIGWMPLEDLNKIEVK